MTDIHVQGRKPLEQPTLHSMVSFCYSKFDQACNEVKRLQPGSPDHAHYVKRAIRWHKRAGMLDQIRRALS